MKFRKEIYGKGLITIDPLLMGLRSAIQVSFSTDWWIRATECFNS